MLGKLARLKFTWQQIRKTLMDFAYEWRKLAAEMVAQ